MDMDRAISHGSCSKLQILQTVMDGSYRKSWILRTVTYILPKSESGRIQSGRPLSGRGLWCAEEAVKACRRDSNTSFRKDRHSPPLISRYRQYIWVSGPGGSLVERKRNKGTSMPGTSFPGSSGTRSLCRCYILAAVSLFCTGSGLLFCS